MGELAATVSPKKLEGLWCWPVQIHVCLHTKFDLMELSMEEVADGYPDKISFPVLITLHTSSCLNWGCIPLDFRHQETRHLYLSGKLLLHCIKREQHSQMVIHLKHYSNLS